MRHYLLGTILWALLTLSWSCGSATSDQQSKTTQGPVADITLYFVRHAEKAQDGTEDPPLTARGQARANTLRDMLAQEGITAIYSTPYQRTRETAAPLATALELDIRPYQPHELAAIHDIIAAHKGERILLVGHSNSTPNFINYLLEEKRLQPLREDEYDKLFKLTIGEEKSTLQIEVIK